MRIADPVDAVGGSPAWLRGRVAEFDADKFLAIVEAVANGATRDTALSQAGVARLAFRCWLRSSPDIAMTWRVAQEAAADWADSEAARLCAKAATNPNAAWREEMVIRDLRRRAAVLNPAEFSQHRRPVE